MSNVNDLSPFECPLCFEVYSAEHYPVTFPCGHSCCKDHSEIKSCFACREPVIFRKLKPSYALRDAAAQYQLLLRAYETALKENKSAAHAPVEVDLLNGDTVLSNQHGDTAPSNHHAKSSIHFAESENHSFDWSLFDIRSPLNEIKSQKGTPFTRHTSIADVRGMNVVQSTPPPISTPERKSSDSTETKSLRSPLRKSIGPADDMKLSVDDLMQLFEHHERR